jgi:translation initiation factor 4G
MPSATAAAAACGWFGNLSDVYLRIGVLLSICVFEHVRAESRLDISICSQPARVCERVWTVQYGISKIAEVLYGHQLGQTIPTICQLLKLVRYSLPFSLVALQDSPQRVQSAPASFSSSKCAEPAFVPTPNRWTPNRAKGEDAIVRSNLNKLTPENFDVLLPKFLEINVASLATLNSIADILFEKAVFESVFCELYVSLLVKINSGLPSFPDDSPSCMWEDQSSRGNVNLVRLICRRCFSSFKDGASLPPIDPELLDDEVREERARKLRRKELGAFVLIGELYKIGIFSAEVIFSCIDSSLQPLNEAYKDVEAACVLVRTCGAALDKAQADSLANVLERFKRLELMETSQSRLRFMVLDVVEESGKRWNSRLEKVVPQKVRAEAEVLVPFSSPYKTPNKFDKSPKLGPLRSPYPEPHFGPSHSHNHHLQQPRKRQ